MTKRLLLSALILGLMIASFEAGRRFATASTSSADSAAPAQVATAAPQSRPEPSPVERPPAPAETPRTGVAAPVAPPASAPRPTAPTGALAVNGRIIAQLSPDGKELRLPGRGVYIPADNKLLLDPDAITGGRVSVGGGERSKISFTNNTNEDLYLFWVDYSGRPTFSDKLRPGQSHGGFSSVGQVHVITKTNGDVFGYINPIAGEDNIDIER